MPCSASDLQMIFFCSCDPFRSAFKSISCNQRIFGLERPDFGPESRFRLCGLRSFVCKIYSFMDICSGNTVYLYICITASAPNSYESSLDLATYHSYILCYSFLQCCLSLFLSQQLLPPCC